MAAEQTELPDFTERTRVAHEGVRAAREGLITAETAKAGKEAEAKAEYYGREREQIEPVFRQREKALAEVPLPKSFEPTQTNSQDLMSLFTLTGIAGMMLGRGGGRQAAVGAQQAMTGMINGYTAGRADLAERERKNFDTNVNLIRARKAEITDAFETALKEAQTIGMSAARSNLDQKLAAAGADILRAKVAVGDAETWVKTVESLNNVELKRSETQNRLELAAERVALEQERAKARAEEKTWREDQRAALAAERAAAVAPSVVKEGDKFFFFNRATGKFLTDEATGDRLEAPPPGRAGSASGPGGVIQFRYNQQIANAAYQASIEVQNFALMPLSAAPPFVAEILTDPAKHITEATKQYFSGKWTGPENRAVQQSLAGLNRAVVAIAAGGRPGGITEASIKEFAKMAPRAGDSKINTYLYLGMIKQEFDVAVKDLQAAQANPEQIRLAELARDNAYEVIPFTVADVTRIMRAGGPAMVNANTTALLAASERIKAFEKGITQQTKEKGPPAPGAPGIRRSENWEKAREAIAGGANRDAVLKRMSEAGEDIGGL